jgi:protein transport protein SEC61 subunit gamma-like protein
MYENEEERSMWARIKSFVRECVRVFKITKKPSKEEYKTISKVAGIGILIIGLLGFIVHLVKTLVFK